jgi:glycosyltransferase involved in cell wall biosynthesis
MKLISIVTACYNEEENVGALYEKVKEVMAGLDKYRYEHIFIDNSSEDRTVEILKQIAAQDTNVKIIVNARNFGHIRSPFHALIQAEGDAVISVVADLQDPPEMIPQFIKKWEEGYKIAIGIKTNSEESPIFFAIRKMYYNLVSRLSEIKLVKNFTGFGLYDKKVIEILRAINDPYPYFRGLICDIGFKRAEIPYTQPARKRGFTKNNFYTLYDMAMLGITNHSKIPLRFGALLGFSFAILSLLVGFGYLVYKIIYWKSFHPGIAPIVIGFFFFASVQLFFLGILGEYIGSIHNKILKRPLVIEEDRINFDKKPDNTIQ